MRSTFFNLLSNFILKLWTVLTSLIVLPIYTKILGFESYGLIGFFGTLVSTLAMLDLGLSTTLNKEMSKSLVVNYDLNEFRNMVYSIEVIYWLIGISIGIIIIIFAPYIAENWIKSEGLSNTHVKYAVMLMGGIIAFQWPLSIYGGAIMGLEKHIPYNVYNIIFITIKNFGVILALKYISASVFSFFLYQIIITVLAAFFLKKLMWYFVADSKAKNTFSFSHLYKIRKFAIGMTSVGLSTLVVLQIDKIILSTLIPLKQFGYYTFGFTIGSSIALLSSVLGAILLPKLYQAVAINDLNNIKIQYHKTTKLYAAVITPPAMLIVFFSKDLLMIWTGNIDVVNNIWQIVVFIAIGGLFNTYVTASYFLMLGYGWTKFITYQNLIASLISIPLLFFSVKYFGFYAASSICLLSNFCYFVISLPLMHKKLLNGELKKVYISDIAPALLISILTMLVFRYLYQPNFSVIFKLIYFSFTTIVTYGIIILISTEYRQLFKNFISEFKIIRVKDVNI